MNVNIKNKGRLIFIALNLLIILVISNLYATDLNQFNLTDINSDSDGNLYLATEYGGLYRSVDNGENWFLTNSLTTKYNISTILYDDFEGLFLSTKDGAFLQSTDKGVTWRIRKGSDYYNGFSPVNNVVITKKKYKVYGCESDYEMSLDNHNFFSFGYSTIRSLYLDKDGTLYACGNFITRNDNIDDLLVKWIDISNQVPLPSFCLSSDNNNRIYIGTEKGIYFSNDKGKSWSLLSQDLVDYMITSIYIGKNNNMFIGIDSNGIFESYDNGKSWKAANQFLINSRVNRIFGYKNNTLFVLTSKNGLFKSINDGISWKNINSDLITKADSLIAEGWMPSVNFYDQFPNLAAITYMKFLKNDSIIVVRDNWTKFRTFNSFTGVFQKDYFLPDSLGSCFYNMINLDTLLISYGNNKFNFGIYSFISNIYKNYFSIDENYFINQFQHEYYLQTRIQNIFYSNDKKNIHIKYIINYAYQNGHDLAPYLVYVEDIINIETGELIKKGNYGAVYSKDMNYYLTDNLKLFDKNDQLIYDINLIPENQNYLINSNIISYRISPNNKKIILLNSTQQNFLVIDFITGKILREIKCSEYNNPPYAISFDDNFLFTASNESAIKIYNLSKSDNAFDKVVFWPGESDWRFAIAEHSNSIVFGGYDRVLRLWKPDLNLTSVEEEYKIKNNSSLIFPNPATDYIEIQPSEGWQPSEGSNIQIFNTLGEIMMLVEQTPPSVHRINISNLTPGMYFIKIGNKVEKFVKL